MIVEKDTGSHHSPNHTIKKKLRICLDPRDLNEALEREPYHTHSVNEITTKLDPEDNIQLPIIAVNMITTQILMSVESQGSFSNKLD